MAGIQKLAEMISKEVWTNFYSMIKEEEWGFVKAKRGQFYAFGRYHPEKQGNPFVSHPSSWEIDDHPFGEASMYFYFGFKNGIFFFAPANAEKGDLSVDKTKYSEVRDFVFELLKTKKDDFLFTHSWRYIHCWEMELIAFGEKSEKLLQIYNALSSKGFKVSGNVHGDLFAERYYNSREGEHALSFCLFPDIEHGWLRVERSGGPKLPYLPLIKGELEAEELKKVKDWY